MLDIAVAYNRYIFLGNDFLTWLWFVIETDQEQLRKYDSELESLYVGSRMVLVNIQNNTKETITIKGDDAKLEEGIMALRKGAVVTEMNLCLKSGDQEWRFTIKGESLNLSGFKIPSSGPVETAEDVAGAVIEKAFLYGQAIELIDHLFRSFRLCRRSGQSIRRSRW